MALDFDAGELTVKRAALAGGGGHDALDGTDAGDLLQGLGGDDTLDGKAGDDSLYGGDGDDRIIAGNGNDLVYAGNGDDYIELGLGNDTLWAGVSDVGDDEIYGGQGDDVLGGNGGNDTIVGGVGADTVYAGEGEDILYGNGTSSTDYHRNELWAGGGNDLLRAGESGDTLASGEGDDTCIGGAGNDAMYGGKQNGAGDTNNDHFEGKGGNDSMYGAVGNDWIDGGADVDLIYGGDGDDTIFGGSGDDIIRGNAGDDYMTGGIGYDAFVIEPGDDLDWITDFDPYDDTIWITAWYNGPIEFSDVVKAGVEKVRENVSGLEIDLGEGQVLFLEGISLDDLPDNPDKLDPSLPEIPAGWWSSAELDLGGSYYSQIDTLDDRDWLALAVDLTEYSVHGAKIVIDMLGSSTGDGTLDTPVIVQVYDNNGFSLPVFHEPGATGSNDRAYFYAYSSNEYMIEVRSSYSIGTYVLEARYDGLAEEIPESYYTLATAPSYGAFFGDIETPGDIDWIGVIFHEGFEYQIDLLGRDGVDDTYIYGIYDESGHLIPGTEDDDGGTGLDARINLVVNESGIYHVAVGAADDATGGYVLNISPA